MFNIIFFRPKYRETRICCMNNFFGPIYLRVLILPFNVYIVIGRVAVKPNNDFYRLFNIYITLVFSISILDKNCRGRSIFGTKGRLCWCNPTLEFTIKSQLLEYVLLNTIIKIHIFLQVYQNTGNIKFKSNYNCKMLVLFRVENIIFT